jgi:uncharacterized membrane protein
MKKEAKSLLIFASVYAVGVALYFQFASAPKKELTSWVLFGAVIALVGYVVPALWRLSVAARAGRK